MTSSNADLRKQVYAFFLDGIKEVPANPTARTDAIMQLFQAQQQQLLTELMGEAENFVLVDASPTDVEIIGSERAVPVAVIEQKLEELK